MTTHYRTRTVDGLDIFSRESGPADAPVVLLLHGFPTSSRMYRDLIPTLAQRYRVLAPDLPGFGYSSVPDGGRDGYGFDAAADVIDHWLDVVGVSRFTPYLMDFGGSIGWRLALKHPDQIDAVIIQNAPLYPEDGGDFGLLPAYWHDPTTANRLAAQDEAISMANVRKQYEAGVPDPSLLDPDAWEIDYAQLHRPGVPDVVTDYLFDISKQTEVFRAAREWLVRTQPPMLIASGRNDPIFPESSQRAFVGDVPAAEYHSLDTGHFALATHAQEIGDLAVDFLDRVHASAPAAERTSA